MAVLRISDVPDVVLRREYERTDDPAVRLMVGRELAERGYVDNISPMDVARTVAREHCPVCAGYSPPCPLHRVSATRGASLPGA